MSNDTVAFGCAHEVNKYGGGAHAPRLYRIVRSRVAQSLTALYLVKYTGFDILIFSTTFTFPTIDFGEDSSE